MLNSIEERAAFQQHDVAANIDLAFGDRARARARVRARVCVCVRARVYVYSTKNWRMAL